MNQTKITLTHGATVLDIVEHALSGDTVKARAYAELLLERLEANDDDVAARRLKAILNGDDKGPIIKPAGEEQSVQVEINKNTVGKQSTIDLGDGMAFTFTLARADEDDWTFRVKLFQDQAILGFPKHNTIGIGFAQESKEGWNTNLPYTVDALEIYEHIKSNKKYDEITDEQCLKAIKAIQECAKAAKK